MENVSIIDWGLHLKLMEKKYGKIKIEKEYFTKKNLEEKFLSKNRYLFEINEITINKDVIIFSCYLNDRKNYFLDLKNKTLHRSYPISDDNLVKDEVTFLWLIKSIYNYIEKKEKEIDTYKEVLKNFMSF